MSESILEVGTILEIDWSNPINNGRSALANNCCVINKMYDPDSNRDYYQIAWFHNRTSFESALMAQTLDNLETRPYTEAELLSWLKVVERGISG
jgi:hypothetical protein